MKRFALIGFMVFCALSGISQDTFVERLQRPVAGQGRVQVRQDAEIAALVSGRMVKSGDNLLHRNRLGQTVSTTASGLQTPDTLVHDTMLWAPGHKVRMNGFRVQVYAGGNSREAKRRAYQMEGQVKNLFPDQPVYTRFVPPRWICHVGDFQTREEALELLEDLRKTGRFPEAITVKCKINAFVYEE